MYLKEIVPELIVQDVGRSISFYVSLGFQLVAQAPEEGKPVWAQLSNGALSIMLQEHIETVAEIPALAEREVGGTALLVLRANSQADVRALWLSSKESQRIILPLRETDYGTVEFGITDPDGYILIFSGE